MAGTIYWNGNRGAVTWGNGSTGIIGTVSEANSLVGSNPGDYVGIGGLTPLPNGNYVVASGSWNQDRGAATWGDGSAGVTGTVSAANSLVGSNPNDKIGSSFTYPSITALSNGNYVVRSFYWNENRGAATWGDGRTGVTGTVSDTNSLVGSNPGDDVGYIVTPLSNGNYVVTSPYWNDYRGAATWGNGRTGISGKVSELNSLVGSNPANSFGAGGDEVGFGGVTPLKNGNYVVSSRLWNGGGGAVTWGNGRTGTSGTVSASNSLVSSNDAVGGGYYAGVYGGVIPLSNGNYVVFSPRWNGNFGAVTWVDGRSGQTFDGLGMITTQNSIVGTIPNPSTTLNITEDSPARTFLVALPSAGGGQVIAGLSNPDELAYAIAPNESVTITPALLTGILDTGAAVVLQASNDITVNDPITVSAGGKAGPLTLESGRSIVLNASISTDNGALTLIANDKAANGVVDNERDPGDATISMSPGTTLDTGSGPLTVDLRDGAGLINHRSGAIILQAVTAGSVSIVNNGLTAGSDVILAPVTTTGPQRYANPNGATLVTGDLTTSNNPIVFNNSATLNAGLTLSAGSSPIDFADGTITPGAGVLTVAGVVDLAASTTLTLALNGPDPGSYTQLAASGPVTLGGTLNLVLAFDSPVGSSFEVLTNTGSGAIHGTFNGLDEGALFSVGVDQFQITYQGGTGGDSVVVTRVA